MSSNCNVACLLQPHLQSIRVPQTADKIYKDECVFSFDTPESETGLYVCLKTFIGLGRDYVESYHRKTGNSAFLHIRRVKREVAGGVQQGDGPEKKITRLAIGVEGGFDPDANKKKYDIEDTYAVVLMPGWVSTPWPDDRLPEVARQSVAAVLAAESASKMAELEALAGTWDGEARIVSKHAHSLVQLPAGKRIPPSGWVCQRCDLTTNLWLNLTDGSILCGRKFYDGTGGNDHAVEHYRTTQHPLAVKLGTISCDGKADVFSYAEDDMVDDPLLKQHLLHWGINVAQMEKTDLSMVELELDLNQRFGEWFSLQESGSQLRPVYGPGCTGLANLGNSCYLNSVMQVLFSIPDFQKRFPDKAADIFEACSGDPATDFNVQMAKLGVGLLSGRYSKAPAAAAGADQSPPGISPLMFKTLIGRGHPDFSSKRQQDAQEFFLHALNTIERNSRLGSGGDPTQCLKFRVEDRVECNATHKVKYTYRTEACLPLPIALETADNKEEVAAYLAAKAEAQARGQKLEQDVVRPHIKLASCLQAFAQTEIVEQFYSTALNAKTTASKCSRLSSFPDYLLLHLKKFTLREDWVPVKLDVAVDMPDVLDMTPLRGTGPQPGEEALPEPPSTAPEPQLDQDMLNQLADMGFPLEACKKAVFFSENQGLEAATNWVMTHIGDSDFADPFVPPGTEKSTPVFVPDSEAVSMIEGMGFTRPQAVKALKATDNNVERAVDWIFSHQDDRSDDAPPTDVAVVAEQPAFRDGEGKYRLVGFISHMGTSTMVGHYVCHILRGQQWLIFNDDKVAVSENPPKELGYLYLYERM